MKEKEKLYFKTCCAPQIYFSQIYLSKCADKDDGIQCLFQIKCLFFPIFSILYCRTLCIL